MVGGPMSPYEVFSKISVFTKYLLTQLWSAIGGNLLEKTIIYFLLFGESKKRVSLILRSWALCSRDGEIPLLVITMLFSYKGRGTRQIWWSLCLGADAQLSDLTWDIVQRFSTRQQPQSFHRVLSWNCCRKMMICHFIEAFKWCRILLLPSF